MTRRSFVAAEVAKRRDDVRRLTAKDSTGRWASYLLLLHPHRVEAFDNRATQGEPIDLDAYGHVFMSCYGKQLTVEMLRTLGEEYGLRYLE